MAVPAVPMMSGAPAAPVTSAEGGVDLFGLTFTPVALLLFALCLFLLTGVYSFLRQGLRLGAVIVFVLAVLAFLAGWGRMG